MRKALTLGLAASLSLAILAASSPAADPVYVKDMKFALKRLESKCGHFFKVKGIKWKKVSKDFLKQAKAVKSDSEHLVLLTRLLARLRDGHCYVKPLARAKGVKWPDDGKGRPTGPGMFWCRVGKKIYIKNAWNEAAGAGLKPGMEILKVGKLPVQKWLEARIVKLTDLYSFSTDQQAFFFACHWGLADPQGTRMKLEIKDLKGKRKKRTLVYGRANPVAWGPAFFPPGIKAEEDIKYGKTKKGYGYIHLRRCPGNLPELVDRALTALGPVPGIILDWRGNSGGGFDHEGLVGRFVPKGKRIAFAKPYASAGPNPYGGPLVVIVDGTVRSAGETGSGMFKEDGRAYMIGESATAGMSSQKELIELPSQLFALFVSIGSNMGRFNKGRGIEGIGVPPHEIVEYDPKDLAAEEDTLIKRAEALLADYPQKQVPYVPKRFGWGR